MSDRHIQFKTGTATRPPGRFERPDAVKLDGAKVSVTALTVAGSDFDNCLAITVVSGS